MSEKCDCQKKIEADISKDPSQMEIPEMMESIMKLGTCLVCLSNKMELIVNATALLDLKDNSESFSKYEEAYNEYNHLSKMIKSYLAKCRIVVESHIEPNQLEQLKKDAAHMDMAYADPMMN